MSEEPSITFITAIWGSITGTLALALQFFRHLADRPKISINASMGIKSDKRNPDHHLYIRIEIVNNGQRASRVEHVAVILPKNPVEVPGMDVSRLKLIRSECVLYDANEKGHFIELPSEGGKQVIEINPMPQLFSGLQSKLGKACVRLTSGKELYSSFSLVSLDDLPKSVSEH